MMSKAMSLECDCEVHIIFVQVAGGRQILYCISGCLKPGSYVFFFMASSVNGQDESSAALWLATWAEKMELSCPLGTTRHVPQRKFSRKP